MTWVITILNAQQLANALNAATLLSQKFAKTHTLTTNTVNPKKYV